MTTATPGTINNANPLAATISAPTIKTVPSLQGTITDKPTVLYSGYQAHRTIMRPNITDEDLKIKNSTIAGERILKLLEAAKRTYTYTLNWRKGTNLPLYTTEQLAFIKDWAWQTGGHDTSEEWVKGARKVFPNTESEILHGISFRTFKVARTHGEQEVLDILKANPAKFVKVPQANTDSATIRMADLLYTTKEADHILDAYDNINTTDKK